MKKCDYAIYDFPCGRLEIGYNDKAITHVLFTDEKGSGTPSELRHRIECLEAMLEAINVPVFDGALIDDFMTGIAVLAAPSHESTEAPQIATEQ